MTVRCEWPPHPRLTVRPFGPSPYGYREGRGGLFARPWGTGRAVSAR